jgi:uncharacterized repeat protein (TIGR03803 family)
MRPSCFAPRHASVRAAFGLLTGTAVALVMFGPLDGADAKSSYAVLYSFQGGSDGIYPEGALLTDGAGNFYGTTYQGGIPDANGYGTVFKLAPDGSETVVHAFAGKPGDGANPYAGFIADSAGNRYSTTINDGAYSGGTVFEIAADGTETLLYSFCAQEDCADGVDPYAGLIEDSAGNFYGTTAEGGSSLNCAYGCGTVFKLAPNGTETVLYSFQGEGAGDGAVPYGGVVEDKKGNFYGTTYQGGTDDYGTVFKLAPDGTETVLHSFTGGSDGSYPDAGLIIKGKNLYGTTYYGGSGESDGTVFQVTTDGTETVLHSFDGTDGESPADGLIESGGNFYGTTVAGGADGAGSLGTVFELAPNGTVTVLHSFTGGSDGAFPYGGLIKKGGYLYGTTSEGGTGGSNCPNSDGCGTVFKVKK